MPSVNTKNRVKVTGIITGLTSLRRPGGRGFHTSSILISRRSGYNDILPVVIPDDLIQTGRDYNGSLLHIEGQYRSYRRAGNCKNKLILYIYVTDMSFPDADSLRVNDIYLEGRVYRSPILRKTPLGRDIADLFITVQRTPEISDYIPCIAWNHTAKMASMLPVPLSVCVNGRIQSRDYVKRRADDRIINNTAYEVSIKQLWKAASDVDISPLSC